MNKLFEVTEDGKVRIVDAATIDNAQAKIMNSRLADRWEVVMSANSRHQLIASGFRLSQ